MGIWDVLSWAADGLKSWLPDPTPVTNACSATYGAGREAAGTIGAAARAEAERTRDLVSSAADKLRSGAADLSPAARRIAEAMPDRDGCARIALVVADRAIAEGTKPYIGPTYTVVKQALLKKDHEPLKDRGVDKKEEELRALQQRVGMLEKALMERQTEEGSGRPPNLAVRPAWYKNSKM